jgi:hypothetical protein
MSALVGADTGRFRTPVSTASVRMVATGRSKADLTAIPISCPSLRTAFGPAESPTECLTLGLTKGTAISIASGVTLPREVPLASGPTHPAAADKPVDRSALPAQRVSEPPAARGSIYNQQTPGVHLALSVPIPLALPNKLCFAEWLAARISLRSTPILYRWWSAFSTGWPRYTRGALRSCGALLLKIDSCSGLMS